MRCDHCDLDRSLHPRPECLYLGGWEIGEPSPDGTSYPDLEMCGRCKDHTTFLWDTVEGWQCVMCGAPPMDPDVELED